MSKGKKKRRNKRRQMPPLTILDKVIYWIAGAAMLAAFVGLFFLWLRWEERVMFSDAQVVCCARHGSFLWAFPGALSLIITGLGFWCWGYDGRRPIFGIKGFRYGPPYPSIYPLFSKDRPPRKPADRRGARRAASVVICIDLLFLAPVLLSVAGRDSLYADGTVQEFSMFGNVREEYGVRDTEQVILSVDSRTSGKYVRTRHWFVGLKLVMTDGTRYDFSSGSFRHDDGETEVRRWIRELEQLMALYPAQRIEIQNAGELDRVITDHGLNETETGILYRLFRIEK